MSDNATPTKWIVAGLVLGGVVAVSLIVLVAAIIPACRRFERRWNRLSDEQAIDPELAPYYRRDRNWVWALALGLPFVVTAVFKLLAFTFT